MKFLSSTNDVAFKNAFSNKQNKNIPISFLSLLWKYKKIIKVIFSKINIAKNKDKLKAQQTMAKNLLSVLDDTTMTEKIGLPIIKVQPLRY